MATSKSIKVDLSSVENSARRAVDLTSVEEAVSLLLSFCHTVHDSAPESSPAWLHVVYSMARRIESDVRVLRQVQP